MTYKRKPSSAISDGKGKQHSIAQTRSTLASLALEDDEESDSEELFEPVTNPNIKQRVISIHPSKFSTEAFQTPPAPCSRVLPEEQTKRPMSILGMLRSRNQVPQGVVRTVQSTQVDPQMLPQSKLTSSMEEEDCTQKAFFSHANSGCMGPQDPVEM